MHTMEGARYQTPYVPFVEAPHRDAAAPTVGEDGLLLHTVPDASRRRDHISDLDDFFTRVYRYHQENGLMNMILREVCDLLLLVFLLSFSLYVMYGVNYEMLLASQKVINDEVVKISLFDGLYSFSEFWHNTDKLFIVLLLVYGLFLLGRICYKCYDVLQYFEIRRFFIDSLKIKDEGTKDITWDEVKKLLMAEQVERRMSVHKDILTPLDIYQRILRQKNHMVALINEKIIPVQFVLPFWGEVVYFTKGYEFNLNYLLFWGPHPVLEATTNVNQLRRQNSNAQKSKSLETQILWLALINLLTMPFLFMYQLLHACYSHVERAKNEPGSLAGRCWSNYAKVYLRHYNELDHELNARLNRAYKPATTYINSFTSTTLATIARSIQFVAGSIFTVLALITLYDTDFVEVEHVITVMALTGALASSGRLLIPDENMVWIPELLMDRIVTNIHYMPKAWNGKIHTTKVRDEFSRLFQYKFMRIIQELLSPIIMPFILLLSVRSRARKIVDFCEKFTVEVEGIDNVCSFAQMNIRQHGSPTWRPQGRDPELPHPEHYASDGGRTELSLLHFAYTNPDWKPPKAGADFLAAIKQEINTNLTTVPENPLCHSTNSFSGTAPQWPNPQITGVASHYQHESAYTIRGVNGSVSKFDGPLHASINSVLRSSQDGSMQQSNIIAQPSYNGLTNVGDPMIQPESQNVHDIGMSCLYLRGLSNYRAQHGQYCDVVVAPTEAFRSYGAEDTTDAEVSQARAPGSDGTISNYGASRMYQRTPSPPTVDPFHDTLMSTMESGPSESVPSQYQNMLRRAQAEIEQQKEQQPTQPESLGDYASAGVGHPLLHFNNR